MKRKIKNPKELKIFAKIILEKIIERKDSKGASVIVLNGDLGSGKTTFVQQIGKILDISEKINSPTFLILKNYKIKNHRLWKQLIHIDAYRLSEKNDFKNIGLLEELKNPSNLIFIEWGNLIEKNLPTNRQVQKIIFKYISEKEREISFQ